MDGSTGLHSVVGITTGTVHFSIILHSSFNLVV